MGKARYLFKKIGDTKGTFSCKDRHSEEQMARTKQKQKRLRRGGTNTEKNYTKKHLNDPGNHDGVVTHLELDILKCEVK